MRALVALLLALGSGPAWACAVCLDAAYGQRGFSAAFVGLMLAPFAVAAAVAGALVWGSRRRRQGR